MLSVQPIVQAWLKVLASPVPLEVAKPAVLVCLEVRVQLEVRVAWVPVMVAWVEVRGARSKPYIPTDGSPGELIARPDTHYTRPPCRVFFRPFFIDVRKSARGLIRVHDLLPEGGVGNAQKPSLGARWSDQVPARREQVPIVRCRVRDTRISITKTLHRPLFHALVG